MTENGVSEKTGTSQETNDSVVRNSTTEKVGNVTPEGIKDDKAVNSQEKKEEGPKEGVDRSEDRGRSEERRDDR
jgi:hypothetical protein